MFGKLLKWDLRNQKEVTILYLVMILVTLLAVLVSRVTWFSQFTFLGEIAIGIAFIANIAGSMVLLILNVLYYYKTMHGASGYLHHSLPATTNKKLLSKWVSMFIYWVIYFILLMLSLNFLFKSLHFAGVSLFDVFGEILNEISIQFQVSPVLFVLALVLIIIVTIVGQVIGVSSVVTIGSTGWFQKKGKLGIVLSYILFSVVGQILGFIGLLIPFNIGITENAGKVSFSFVQMSWSVAESTGIGIIPLGTLILSMVFTVGLAFITKYLLNKKLNVM